MALCRSCGIIEVRYEGRICGLCWRATETAKLSDRVAEAYRERRERLRQERAG